jgi:ElaB/YqjD/DUF883 family membrane-anchored ribosome-binding protein
MDQGQGQERARQLSDDPDRVAELRTEIEDVRADLGDTVEALAAKTDVKARAREKAEALKAKAASAMPSSGGDSAGGGGVASGASSGLTQARTWARQNPVPTAALGAAIGGFLIGRMTKRCG